MATSSKRQPINASLRIYAFLARRKRPKSYLGKIMLVAFLGTHIPLLTLFFYAISATNLELGLKVRILVVALVATLVGTVATLFTLQRLLIPITLTFRSLRRYLELNILPALPTEFTDEAGTLMADTMYAIAKLDESIHQLKYYDPLTALPNQELFQRRLGQALIEAKQENRVLAIARLDLDNFSAFNNSLGREQGDWLLRQVANRLSN
ncbi:MAG: GGDEF domain-containing protein, partial [Kamptonema sp. SIO4C4]|nr:GGDEF domain-containing protein [Kamptonema sp. SIO4C4]